MIPVAGWYGSCILSFLRNCCFPEGLHHIAFSPAVFEQSSSLASLPASGVAVIFYFGHLDRYIMKSQCGFNLLFPSRQRGWRSFQVFIHHLHSLCGEMYLQVHCLLSNYIFFPCWILRILYISCLPVLCQRFAKVSKYFLLVFSLSFHPLNRLFHRTKIFNFDEIQLTSFSFMDCTFDVQCKSSVSNPRSLRFFSHFSPRSYSLVFTFESMIHFELILI